MLLFKEAALPKPLADNKIVLNFNQNQVVFTKLSSKAQEFYYWVNYSRLEPESFYNNVIIPIVKTYPQLKGENLQSLEADLRNSKSLSLLRLNDTLLKMSAYQANDITSSNVKPSHNSSTGETFADRFKRFGLKNCGGENISFGAGDADPLFMLVLLYLDINVADLGHRKALLNPSFTNTGIAVTKYENGNTFLVQDFACSQK